MKYIITNTITKESESVFSTDSMSAKRFVCARNGWNTRDCSVRAISC